MERKEYKRYTREFKLEAVRLAALDERPKAQMARQLGIRVNQLRKWRLQFQREERAACVARRARALRRWAATEFVFLLPVVRRARFAPVESRETGVQCGDQQSQRAVGQVAAHGPRIVYSTRCPSEMARGSGAGHPGGAKTLDP